MIAPRLRLALAALPCLLVAGVCAPPASAASTCAAQGIGVSSLQSNVFYIDVGENYLGSYVGYRVTNTGAAPRAKLWVTLESFTGGVVAPASGAASTAPLALDTLAAGASTPAYAYLRAGAATSTAQGHDVVVHDGRPGAGGAELCRETQTIAAVADVIKAAANKVTGSSRNGDAELGGTFTISVQGNTGTIGSGPANDPGIVRFSPAVAASWPSSAFRLVGVSHRLPDSGSAFASVLSRSGLNGSGDTPYTVTYTFRVVGPTASPTTIVPVQNIASGTQVKHTDPGTLSTLAPIPPVVNNTTIAVDTGAAGPYTSGSSVPLTATVTNTGTSTVSVDELVVTLPPGWNHVPGSGTFGGDPVGDPHADGDELHFVGPFTVPGGSSGTLSLEATAGAPGSSGEMTATGTLAGGQIDGTTDLDDDAPASRTLTVLGPPSAAADTATAYGGVAATLDVLDNDDIAGGTPAIEIVQQPAHGTATIVDGRVRYVPDGAYTGPDELVYRLTTEGGTSDATVSITVAEMPLPVAEPHTSSGTGVAPQQATLDIPPGGTVTLLTAFGQPATTVTVLGQGTYVLDVATGVVTFTPIAGFAGTATPVGYRVTDGLGRTASSTYTPTVLAPAGPSAAPLTSSGVGTERQSRTVAVPEGGSLRLVGPGGAPVTSLDVPGQGTYALGPASGEISFTPVFGFSGTASGAQYRLTDVYGLSATSTYTPSVAKPAAPEAPPRTSTGVGTAQQQQQVPVPAGGSAHLVAPDGSLVARLTTAQGTYAIDPDTGRVTFTPRLGFAGTADAVTYAVTDAYGQSTRGTYVPDVRAPAAPPAAPQTSTGKPTETQARVIDVPEGGSLELLDASGTPVREWVVAGQGRYVVDPVQRTITFVPEPGFTGRPAPARYRVLDAYGQSVEATYQPDVEAARAATCASRRAMTINWWVARTTKLRSITVTMNGERVARLRGTVRRVTVDMKGRPAQRVAVRVAGRTTAGRIVSTTRTYRTCRARRQHKPLATLRLLPETKRKAAHR